MTATAPFRRDGSRRRLPSRAWPTTYTLDALCRTVAEVCADESRYTWTYDPLGRQTLMGDGTGLTSYTYDQAGRQTQVALPIGRTLSYSYNALGQRA